MTHYTWTLLEKYDQDTIIKTYKKLANQQVYPAANQLNFLQPILNIFFENNEYIHAVLYKDSQPIFAFPIVKYKRKKFFVSWWELGFPFHNHINLTMIPKELDSSVFKLLVDDLEVRFKGWARFSFRNIQIHSSTMEYSGDVAWFNALDNIETIVSKKHLRNVRRLEKKLIQDYSDITFKIQSHDHQDALKQFADLEQFSWKGQDGIAINNDAKTQALYKSFCQTDSKMIIGELRHEDTLIAAAIGFHLGDTLFIHKISHCNTLSKYAPGNILILNLLEHAIKSNDIAKLNLVTRPNWANRWHPSIDHLYNFVYYRKTVYGRVLEKLILKWRSIKPHMKSILRINA